MESQIITVPPLPMNGAGYDLDSVRKNVEGAIPVHLAVTDRLPLRLRLTNELPPANRHPTGWIDPLYGIQPRIVDPDFGIVAVSEDEPLTALGCTRWVGTAMTRWGLFYEPPRIEAQTACEHIGGVPHLVTNFYALPTSFWDLQAVFQLAWRFPPAKGLKIAPGSLGAILLRIGEEFRPWEGGENPWSLSDEEFNREFERQAKPIHDRLDELERRVAAAALLDEIDGIARPDECHG